MYAVRSPNACRAIPDNFDGAVGIVDFNKIANAYRPLGHQDPAADKVIDDVLCAEADADGNGTGRKGKRRQRDSQQAESRHGDEDYENEKCDSLQNVDDVRSQIRR